MINGHAIREARVARRLSQSELAAGITTQANISRIENDNVDTNSQILEKLARRLRLSVDKILITGRLRPSAVLTTAEECAKKSDYQGVLRTLKHIEPNTLFSDDEFMATFLRVDAAMYVSQDYDRAIFEFNKLLSVVSEHGTNIFLVLATSQLGVAYSCKNQIDLAAYYFEQLPELLDQIKVSEHLFWVLFAMDSLANYWLTTGQYEKSSRYSDQALKTAAQYQVTYLTGQSSFIIGQCSGHLNGWDAQETQHYLSQAWYFAQFTDDQADMTAIQKSLTEHQIVVV